MRTTVTLDPDVYHLLQEKARRAGRPFKTTLNEAIRCGLQTKAAARAAPPDWPCMDLGAPLVDLNKGMALADELDDRAAMDAEARPWKPGA